MTISNILEHWASIYRPLSHHPESERLEDQSFFRVRYIDLENIFSRNANIIHSPCMLYSVLTTGELVDAKKASVSHQVWFLAKVKDTPQTLGRYDGNKIERVTQELCGMAMDLCVYLTELKRSGGVCPITKRSFKSDPQLAMELQALKVESIGWGIMPHIIQNNYLCCGVDWESTMPLYNFACGSTGKYIIPEETL